MVDWPWSVGGEVGEVRLGEVAGIPIGKSGDALCYSLYTLRSIRRIATGLERLVVGHLLQCTGAMDSHSDLKAFLNTTMAWLVCSHVLVEAITAVLGVCRDARAGQAGWDTR